MDVKEILSYNPPSKSARRRSANNEEDAILKQMYEKRLKVNDVQSLKNDIENKGKSSKNVLPEINAGTVHESGSTAADAIDGLTVRKLLLNFEKRLYKNQEMRIKFPDHPEKFMDSEVDLHTSIEELGIISTAPEHYGFLIELNCVKSMLGLLSHENADLGVAITNVVHELVVDEDSEMAETLLESLLDNQVVSLLLQNAERLDETIKDESDAVFNSLSIVECILDYKPTVATDLAQKQGLMPYLLKRLKSKLPFDQNKLYASEILSILVQGEDENREFLGSLDGIDVLLQQLATYKRNDPSTQDEVELMENLFNCLCSCLLLPSNHDRFLVGEGLQLMNLMLREKKLSRFSAVKTLDYAMSGSKANCKKFVDILGLRTIFPLFMRPPKGNKTLGYSRIRLEEYVLSIICSMTKHVDGPQRQRLMNKFLEDDMTKVDRLMELHFKYMEKVHTIDQVIDHQVEDMDREPTEDEAEEMYTRRLNSGLYTLHRIDFVVLEVSSSSQVKQRVMEGLNLRRGSIKAIRNVMREYSGNIEDSAERQKVINLVDKF